MKTKKSAIPKAKNKNENKKVVNKKQSAASSEEQIQQPKNGKLKRPEPKEEAGSKSTVGRIERIRNSIGIKRSSSKNRANDVKKKKAKNGTEQNFDMDPTKTMKEEGVMEDFTQPKILSEEQRIQLGQQVTGTNTTSNQDVPGNSSDFSDAKSDFGETDSTGKEGTEDRPGCAVSATAHYAEDNEQSNEGTSYEHDPECMQNQRLSFEHTFNQSAVSIRYMYAAIFIPLLCQYYRKLYQFFLMCSYEKKNMLCVLLSCNWSHNLWLLLL